MDFQIFAKQIRYGYGWLSKWKIKIKNLNQNHMEPAATTEAALVRVSDEALGVGFLQFQGIDIKYRFAR